MELKFNSFKELVDFLDEIGYTLKRKEENVEENDTELGKIGKGIWKDYPHNPFNPIYPSYPNYPIVSFDSISNL